MYTWELYKYDVQRKFLGVFLLTIIYYVPGFLVTNKERLRLGSSCAVN